MKSKIIFSLFVLCIFIAGLTAGFFVGNINYASPIVGQLWAGAKEMQATISLIDKKDLKQARSLLCNSIQSRLIIMDQLQPLENDATANRHKELESYLYEVIEKDKKEFRATCQKQGEIDGVNVVASNNTNE